MSSFPQRLAVAAVAVAMLVGDLGRGVRSRPLHDPLALPKTTIKTKTFLRGSCEAIISHASLQQDASSNMSTRRILLSAPKTCIHALVSLAFGFFYLLQSVVRRIQNIPVVSIATVASALGLKACFLLVVERFLARLGQSILRHGDAWFHEDAELKAVHGMTDSATCSPPASNGTMTIEPAVVGDEATGSSPHGNDLAPIDTQQQTNTLPQKDSDKLAWRDWGQLLQDAWDTPAGSKEGPFQGAASHSHPMDMVDDNRNYSTIFTSAVEAAMTTEPALIYEPIQDDVVPEVVVEESAFVTLSVDNDSIASSDIVGLDMLPQDSWMDKSSRCSSFTPISAASGSNAVFIEIRLEGPGQQDDELYACDAAASVTTMSSLSIADWTESNNQDDVSLVPGELSARSMKDVIPVTMPGVPELPAEEPKQQLSHQPSRHQSLNKASAVDTEDTAAVTECRLSESVMLADVTAFESSLVLSAIRPSLSFSEEQANANGELSSTTALDGLAQKQLSSVLQACLEANSKNLTKTAKEDESATTLFSPGTPHSSGQDSMEESGISAARLSAKPTDQSTLCQYFLVGKCCFNNSCKYSHDIAAVGVNLPSSVMIKSKGLPVQVAPSKDSKSLTRESASDGLCEGLEAEAQKVTHKKKVRRGTRGKGRKCSKSCA